MTRLYGVTSSLSARRLGREAEGVVPVLKRPEGDKSVVGVFGVHSFQGGNPRCESARRVTKGRSQAAKKHSRPLSASIRLEISFIVRGGGNLRHDR